MTIIRPPCRGEHDVLLGLWERSVRATHGFLGETDIAFYKPVVWEALRSSMELWLACDAVSSSPVGFMGLAAFPFPDTGAKIEALFIDPAQSRQGAGTRLVCHARILKGVLTLDVNEQNPDALAFYERLGFSIIGRSPHDSAGRPFPLVHMRGGNRSD